MIGNNARVVVRCNGKTVTDEGLANALLRKKELASRARLAAMVTSDVFTQTPDPAAPAGLAVQG